MAINNSRVLMGGVAAGVVLNIIDALANGVIFAERMKAEANAFKPGLGDMNAMMDGKTIAGYVIMDFIVGGLLVWTYAAMRPRFGAGPKTASYVALVFFVFGMILTSGYMQMGLMSSGLWMQYAFLWLINLVLASMAGAWVYREEGA